MSSLFRAACEIDVLRQSILMTNYVALFSPQKGQLSIRNRRLVQSFKANVGNSSR